MADQPIAKTTIVTDAISNLYGQFQGAPKMNALLAAYAAECQEIENMLMDVLIYRAVSAAVGVQLDVIGRIVGERRLGRNDDEYSIALSARVIANRSGGTVEDIIAVMRAATENRTFEVTDLEMNSVIVRLVDAIGTLDPDILGDLLSDIEGAGIRADFVYSEEDDTDTFQFASGDVEEVDASAGLADDTGTTGGSFAGVKES